MRYSVRVFAEGERLPAVDRTVAVEARDIAEARERGLACIDEVEVWDGWQDDDTDERVTRYLTDIVRQEGLAERLEKDYPLAEAREFNDWLARRGLTLAEVKATLSASEGMADLPTEGDR